MFFNDGNPVGGSKLEYKCIPFCNSEQIFIVSQAGIPIWKDWLKTGLRCHRFQAETAIGKRLQPEEHFRCSKLEIR